MLKNAKIYVAGHRGLVGSAIVRELQRQGYQNLILKTHAELDLTNQKAVAEFFAQEKPEYVFLAAAFVGGMLAQLKFRSNFLYENLMMQNNVIHQAYLNGVKKLIFLGSLCVYPEHTSLPIQEDSMLNGYLQPNNEPYGIAKIAGSKMCELYSKSYDLDFIPIMPCSVYGIEDNFDIETSHVQAAIFRKIYLATCLQNREDSTLISDLKMQSKSEAIEYLKSLNITADEVQLLGDGTPQREFLYSDDLARSCVYLAQNIRFAQIDNASAKNANINVGTGEMVSIKELAEVIARVVGFKGKISFQSDFNQAGNNGTAKKLASLEKIHALGWRAEISLKDGIQMMYEWYVKQNTARR
ncbi:GDP-L-fucose synthase [Helicobacter sp. MIT 05-5294]|uniref:GDP-L-fucose synthase family protein n=1 Tax=Helicobacter sp. MIT 05-5294 TaxID=1548150 RepID=UPI00051FCB8F|nr:GDP-L-fucose synthase [Helicobacter sp. MIT 05-5294]TLD88614.1 GDP-L-fucose synthase [Helicobacter sp. MIT 05-5294]